MTEYNKIINDINNGKLSPVYLIHGEENYFKDNIIKIITDSVIDEASVDFDLKKIMLETEIKFIGDNYAPK